MREQMDHVNKSRKISNLCVNSCSHNRPAHEQFHDLGKITDVGKRTIARQNFIADLVARGLTYSQIASYVGGISRSTVSGLMHRRAMRMAGRAA